MKIRSPPGKLRQGITDHFLIAFFKHAASITESLLRTDCCWLFFGKVYWPTPFNMHFDFCPLLRKTFAELSRISLFTQTPAISRGRIEGKANTRGLCLFFSQSLTFGNLAAACGAYFLRLQKSALGNDSGRCKDVLQDHGAWLSRGLTFGSSAATYEVHQCPAPAGPQAAVGGWQPFKSNFREKNVTFAHSNKKLSRHNMNGLRN